MARKAPTVIDEYYCEKWGGRMGVLRGVDGGYHAFYQLTQLTVIYNI